MTDTTYNGWTNRETWCVNLWLGNEQATHSDIQNIVSESAELYQAGDAISSYVEQLLGEERTTATMSADLLGCALARVNWREIAEGYWSDKEQS